MLFKHLQGTLRDAAGDGGGTGAGAGQPSGDGVLTPEMIKAINAEANNAITGYLKKELPKLIGSALKEQMPQMQENFLEALANELPTDDELAEMEANGELGDLGGEGGGGEGGGGSDDLEGASPELNAHMRKMQRQNQELQRQLDELQQYNEQTLIQAEAADRNAHIEQLLTGYNWANPDSRSMVANFLATNAWRDEDGNLVAGEENSPIPLKDFAEERIKTMPNFLSPQSNTGGAGAVPGGRTPGAPTLDQIKVGMPKEQMESIMSHAVKQLGHEPSGSGA